MATVTATLAAQITSTGISAPSYADILQQLKNTFWSIYGSDANLDDDSQDGQWIAVFAQAINDSNQTAINVYNSFSPANAQGAALASVVKINGMAKKPATFSSTPATVVGVVGTTINNGLIGDGTPSGVQWALPAVVVIPEAGQIDVTVTSTTAGAVQAGANTLTSILTPVLGWQSVTNEDAATPGVDMESDAALRLRQSQSTALSSKTILEGIFGAIFNVPNVTDLQIYENDTDAPDANGVPGHSIAAVVLGGDVTAIAQTIAETKSPGTGTFGNVSQIVIDPNGVPDNINFFVMTLEQIYATVTINPMTGYSDAIGASIQQSVSDWINSLSTGEDVFYGKLWGPANLFANGTTNGETFNVANIGLGTAPAPNGTSDIAVPFTSRASCTPANINLVVIT